MRIKFLSLFIISIFILSSQQVLADTADGALQEAFGAILGPNLVENLLSWKITLPLDYGKDSTFPGLFVILMLAALTSIFFATMRKTVGIFKYEAGQPNNKNAALVVALGISLTTILLTPFLYYVAIFVSFITAWGFFIIIILSFWFGLKQLTKGIRKTNAGAAKTEQEYNDEGNRLKAKEGLEKTEQDYQKWKADEAAMQDANRNIHTGLQKLRNLAGIDVANARDIVKVIDEILKNIPDPGMLTSAQQKSVVSQVGTKIAALINKIQGNWTNMKSIEGLLEQIENALHTIDKTRRGKTLMKKFNKVIKDIQDQITKEEAEIPKAKTPERKKQVLQAIENLNKLLKMVEQEVNLLKSLQQKLKDLESNIKSVASSDTELKNKISDGLRSLEIAYSGADAVKIVSALREIRQAEVERQKVEQHVQEIFNIDNQIKNIEAGSNAAVNNFNNGLKAVLATP